MRLENLNLKQVGMEKDDGFLPQLRLYGQDTSFSLNEK